MISRTRFAAAAGLTALAALLPATASADPTDELAPLLDSTCSFAQVDAALHDQAPNYAAMLDNNPNVKNQLRQLFDQPIEQRRAQVQQYLAEHPDQVQQAENDPRAAQARQLIQQLADTCANY
ncbi:hemophore-related protein [Nocardia sp. CDC159]|uniref:Hemophore-related protein n=1 Tax=Nocardia pulmonis TaxID=2951408 RepID=A0A9X2E2G5_9NOCA|nr:MULTISPECIES: hemophore-related protein [Nocardia]MCM6773054.1 hemophore-related protein [Nocardia pulmonis]MCM6785643.1 hemophore-related protein [Nocardia sp. CDC159]